MRDFNHLIPQPLSFSKLRASSERDGSKSRLGGRGQHYNRSTNAEPFKYKCASRKEQKQANNVHRT